MSDRAADNVLGAAVRPAASRLLVGVGRQGGPWVAAVAVTTLATACAETLLPAVLGRAFDAVTGGSASQSWLVWCGALVALLVAFDALDDLAAGAATARSTAWLRHTVLGHVLALGPRAAERFAAGDLASRLVGNAEEAGRAAPEIVRAGANLIPAVGGIAALALIDPWLCLTALAGMPVLVLLVRAFARDASRFAAGYLEVQGRIAGRLVDAMSGARTIAAAGTTGREAQRVLAPLPQLHRHGMDMWRAQRRISAQDAVLVALLEIAVLAVAGALLARGRISPGEMLAAGQYALLATTLGSAVTGMSRLVRARAAAGRAADVLAEPAMPYGTLDLPAGPGRIEFRGVVARVGGRRVLDGIDLIVPAGSLVALVGPTGVGKSLLAALAGRLVDPDEGEVLLDGLPLPRVSRRALRREVGYGFERPALIGETIADAIGLGVDTPSSEQVVAAARAARADDFIRRLPEGYRTPLADAPMSGGELQRLGLARAFAHAGRLLILDDVAASLDTVTEDHIGRALTGELADRTRIIVAHRASTAARADLVVWLESGRVRALAPHDELWRSPGYRALFAPGGPATEGGGDGSSGRTA